MQGLFVRRIGQARLAWSNFIVKQSTGGTTASCSLLLLREIPIGVTSKNLQVSFLNCVYLDKKLVKRQDNYNTNSYNY